MTKIISLLAAITMCCATAQDTSRQIWDDYFGSARPKGPSGRPPAQKPEYHAVSHPQKTSKPASKGRAAAVGVTIWKLEQPSGGDGARLLVQEASGSPVQLTPHRLQAGETLHPGDRVRLSIEAPSDGYLYVIDQELRANGTSGTPYLIFPTTRGRGGDNRVHAGQLVEIPAQTDRYNVFRIEPKSAGERGEKLTLLLSPEPIAGISVGEREQEIPLETFASWLSKWNSSYELFELASGKGRGWTEAEKEAGQSNSRLLTQDDPAPQSVYLFPGKAGRPIVVSVALQVR